MAIEKSPRLGIERWSHGTDRHPPRAVWDAQQGILDDLVAIDRQYATLAERPAAGVRGTYCWVEETGILYRDDGAQWRPVVQFGGGAGAAVVAGGSGSEGSSSRSARADHSHPLPLVTSSAHGAMRKEDKAKLDEATPSPTGGTMVRRDGAGSAVFSSLGLSTAPASSAHATRKDYVDAQVGAVHNATLLPAAANLDAYTSPGVYGQSSHTGAANGANYPVPRAGLLLVHTAGDFVFQRYVVTRLEAGGHQDVDYKRTRYSGTWGPWREQASTDYVDAGDAAARSYADGAVAAIPEATSSRAGLMPAADKALVDGATSSAAVSGSRLVRRDSGGRYGAADPSSDTDVVNKRTMDAGDATRLPFALDPGNGSLDQVVADGVYRKVGTSTIGNPANNYPPGTSGAGVLVVTTYSTSGVVQEWTCWGVGVTSSVRKWVRNSNDSGSTWTGWRELAGTEVATASADGLMSSSDKSLLNAATANATGNALMRRDSSGRASVGTPTSATHVARKDYVDAGDATAQSNAEATAAAALAPVKALTDAATANPTANALVRRDSAGRFKSATPSATTDVANKSYVDGRANTAQSNAESTASTALAPVKALTDAATSSATGNTLMQRDSGGRVSVSTPTSSSHAATKGYADGEVSRLDGLLSSMSGSVSDLQASRDALTYNSGVREKVFTGNGGEKCTVRLARIGPVVMLTIDDFRHADLVTMFLSGEIPGGFRPMTRAIASSVEGSSIHVEATGTTLIRARGPENSDVYARRASVSYLTTDSPPSSFTWGDPV